MYPFPGTYKIIVQDAQERTSAAYSSSNLTGVVYHAGDLVNITRVQVNSPGVAEWGQLDNGNWIATVWNGRLRVEAVTATPPQTDDPSYFVAVWVDANGDPIRQIKYVPE